MDARSHPPRRQAWPRICFCLAALAAAPASAARGVQATDDASSGERQPGRAGLERDPAPPSLPDARRDSLGPPPALRLTPGDVTRLERRVAELRERALDLRAERSRLGDELRRLNDVHGSLDEALGGLSSFSLGTSRRRQNLEERERDLLRRMGALEEEERRMARLQADIEKLLREIRPAEAPVLKISLGAQGISLG